MQSPNVPDGFTVQNQYSNTFTITYRSQGIGNLLFCLFILIWLVIAARIVIIGFLPLIKSLLQSDANNQPQIITMFLENWTGVLFITLIMTVFSVIYFWLLFFLLKKAFGVTTFEINPDTLIVTRQLFGFKRSQKILSSNMVKLKQRKLGSKRKYSFFWALWIYAPKRVCLLSSEPSEKSDWLGEFLSDYYHLKFEKFPKRR